MRVKANAFSTSFLKPSLRRGTGKVERTLSIQGYPWAVLPPQSVSWSLKYKRLERVKCED